MRFTKMHGLGNDYLFLDAWREPSILSRANLPEITRAMCDRNEGVGADGVIVVSKPENAAATTIAMRVLNADGSDGGMCGNGARCVCKLAVERGYVKPGTEGRMALRVAGRSHDLAARVHFDAARPGVVGRVEIDMGPPELELDRIPVDASRLGRRTDPLHAHEHFVDGHAGVFVNMGNPHFVVFTQHDPDALADRIGPSLEAHPAFPQRMNVQIVRVQDHSPPTPARLVLRSWERGAGRTRACGTGACAAIVAGVLTNRAHRLATVSMLGGELDLAWPERTGHVVMTGPAEHAYDGEWEDSIEDLCALMALGVPTIRTTRLVLRAYRPEDLPQIERLMSLPEVARNTRSWPVPYMPGDAAKFLRRVGNGAATGDSCGWAMCEPGTDRLVGSVGIRIDREIRTAEAGYCTLPECWGKGYTTEALRAVIGHAFGGLGLRKLHADFHATNVGSGRVLEKCGFTRAALRIGHGERAGVVHDLVQMDLLNPGMG
ncbi:MAG: diaminopimelate epimerase [Phycisphaerales bacterium]